MNKVKRFSTSLYSKENLDEKINDYAKENNLNPISISVFSDSLSTIAYVVFEPIVTHYV